MQESFLVGIAVLVVVVVPCNLVLAQRVKRFYRATMKASDARVSTTVGYLEHNRSVKLSSFERLVEVSIGEGVSE